jgi:hypothetical protein
VLTLNNILTEGLEATIKTTIKKCGQKMGFSYVNQSNIFDMDKNYRFKVHVQKQKFLYLLVFLYFFFLSSLKMSKLV